MVSLRPLLTLLTPSYIPIRIHSNICAAIVLPLLLLLYAPVPEGARAVSLQNRGAPAILHLQQLQVQPRQQTQAQTTQQPQTQQAQTQTTQQAAQTQATASSTVDFWWPYPLATDDPGASSSADTGSVSTVGTTSGFSSSSSSSLSGASSTAASSTSVSFSSISVTASASDRPSKNGTANNSQTSSSNNNSGMPLVALIAAFAAVGVFTLGLLAWVTYRVWARRRRRIRAKDVEGVTGSGGRGNALARPHGHRHEHRHKHHRPRGWAQGKGRRGREKEGEELLCGPEYGVGFVGENNGVYPDRERLRDVHRGWRACDSPVAPSWAARVSPRGRATERDSAAQALWERLDLCELGEDKAGEEKCGYGEDEVKNYAHQDEYDDELHALPSVSLVHSRTHTGLKPGAGGVGKGGRGERGSGEGGLSSRPSIATRRSDATSAMLCAMYESASESGDEGSRTETPARGTSDKEAIGKNNRTAQGRIEQGPRASWADRQYASIRADLVTRVKEAEDARALRASRAHGNGTARDASSLAAEADSAAVTIAADDGRARRCPGGASRVLSGAAGIDGGGDLGRRQIGLDNDTISRWNNSTASRGSLAARSERGWRGSRGDEGEDEAYVGGGGRCVGGVVGERDGDGLGHAPAHKVALPGRGHVGHGQTAELRAAEDAHTPGGVRSARAYPPNKTNTPNSAGRQTVGCTPDTQLNSIKPLRISARSTAASLRGNGRSGTLNATGAVPRPDAGPCGSMREIFDKVGMRTGDDHDAAGLDFDVDFECDPVSSRATTRAWRRGSKWDPGDPDANGGRYPTARGHGYGYEHTHSHGQHHGNEDEHDEGCNSEDELKYIPPAVPRKAKKATAHVVSPPPRGRRGYAPLKGDADDGDRYTRAPARRSESHTRTRSASRDNGVDVAHRARSPALERRARAPGALPLSPAQLMSPALAAQMCFTAAGEGMAKMTGRGASEKGHGGSEGVVDRLPIPFPAGPTSPTAPKRTDKPRSAFPARLRKRSRPTPVPAVLPSSTRSAGPVGTSLPDSTRGTPNVDEAARERVARVVEVGWGARERVVGLEALRSLSPTGFGRERA